MSTVQLYVGEQKMDEATQARIETALARDGLRLAESDEDGPFGAWTQGVGIGPAQPGGDKRSFRVLVCDVSREARRKRLGAL